MEFINLSKTQIFATSSRGVCVTYAARETARGQTGERQFERSHSYPPTRERAEATNHRRPSIVFQPSPTRACLLPLLLLLLVVWCYCCGEGVSWLRKPERHRKKLITTAVHEYTHEIFPRLQVACCCCCCCRVKAARLFSSCTQEKHQFKPSVRVGKSCPPREGRKQRGAGRGWLRLATCAAASRPRLGGLR